jgi:sigma54-dependent transcription regulator
MKKNKTGSGKGTSKKTGVKKKGQTRKSAGRRAASSASGGGARAVQLRNELKKLSGAMTAEDIGTLLDQARILIHNREVLDSAERLKSAAQARVRAQGVREQNTLRVKVREAADLSYFFIDFYGYENFFSRDEMRKIVKMCESSADRADAGRRLFNWFKNDRSDVLKNTGLESSRDPILGTIYDYIIRNYSLKK